MTPAEFKAWLAVNRPVWELFSHFTQQVIRAGHKHYSADAVLHRIRWETDVAQVARDPFKLNNNLTAHLARHFHEKHPEHAGFFRTRKTKQDDEGTWQLVDDRAHRIVAQDLATGPDQTTEVSGIRVGDKTFIQKVRTKTNETIP